MQQRKIEIKVPTKEELETEINNPNPNFEIILGYFYPIIRNSARRALDKFNMEYVHRTEINASYQDIVSAGLFQLFKNYLKLIKTKDSRLFIPLTIKRIRFETFHEAQLWFCNAPYRMDGEWGADEDFKKRHIEKKYSEDPRGLLYEEGEDLHETKKGWSKFEDLLKSLSSEELAILGLGSPKELK